MRIFLDMDGVITDLVSHIITWFGLDFKIEDWPPGEYDLAKVLGIPTYELWSNLPIAFWESIPPTEEFDEIKSLLKDQDCWICTKPTDDRSIVGKLHWIQKYYPEMIVRERVIFISNKSLLAQNSALLIDDDEVKTDEFERFDGTAILVPRSWNRGYKMVMRPIEIIEAGLRELDLI